jgi:hypothetical protein
MGNNAHGGASISRPASRCNWCRRAVDSQVMVAHVTARADGLFPLSRNFGRWWKRYNPSHKGYPCERWGSALPRDEMNLKIPLRRSRKEGDKAGSVDRINRVDLLTDEWRNMQFAAGTGFDNAASEYTGPVSMGRVHARFTIPLHVSWNSPRFQPADRAFTR